MQISHWESFPFSIKAEKGFSSPKRPVDVGGLNAHGMLLINEIEPQSRAPTIMEEIIVL